MNKFILQEKAILNKLQKYLIQKKQRLYTIQNGYQN